MENKSPNNQEQKTPNYLKRISSLEKNVEELKTNIKTLQIQVNSILNALKRK